MTGTSGNNYRRGKIVGYQCFVDSFAAGKKDIRDKSNLYPQSVYDHPARLLDWSDDFPEYCYGYAFYGGDLKGIGNSIGSYLSELGIDMLYLTPIFKAESNHKYDTLDYRLIDPQFGDLGAFRDLAEACRANHIALILDGVFNHTSYHHDWFVRAQKGESPFKDYYRKDGNGRFLLWNGTDALPVLDHSHPDVRSYLYDSPESVVLYWLGQGADGWRLDVAEGLGQDVIRRIKKAIRSRYTDRMLYGEVVESYGRDWIGDDLLDGVMNYSFLGNTVNFLKGSIDGGTYLYELGKMYDEYPREQLYNSWNIISTHDTSRMIHEVGGNENLFKMAVALQFTYPGIPMIYNGDELGILPGEKDRSNRQGLDWERVDILKLKAKEPWKSLRTMPWSKLNQYSSFHFFYRHLIWLRKNHGVLVDGDFLPAYRDKDVVAYFRVLGERHALLIVNRGPTKEISMEIPERVRRSGTVLKGVHGHVSEVRLHDKSLKITVNGQNSLIFVG